MCGTKPWYGDGVQGREELFVAGLGPITGARSDHHWLPMGRVRGGIHPGISGRRDGVDA